MLVIPDVPGADHVVGWFGYWPSFHDAEVLSIALNRSRESYVQVHTWERTSEVDAKGYFVRRKFAIVTFVLENILNDYEGIARMRIEWFNHQNVLWGLRVIKLADGYMLGLDGIYGVDGFIDCEHLSVKLEPGIPEG